jgi:hypothetical protein
VDRKLKARLLLLLVALVCAGAVGTAVWRRARPMSNAAMFSRMSAQDSMILYIDFDALRQGGILQRLVGSKAVEDPDYQRFVNQIGFDYKEQLDSAMVAFAPEGKFMFLRGQFDWNRLRTYAKQQGGICRIEGCRMTGSTPERQISFLPVQKNLIALAVSPTQEASLLTSRKDGPDPEIPRAPVWLWIPNSVLKSGYRLPSGTRSFTRSIEYADRVILTLGLEEGRFAVRMEVQCVTEFEAAEVVSQLRQATTTLRQMIEREKVMPNPADLSGVLASGTFHAEGLRAMGRWWIDDAFIDNVWVGGVN